MIDIFLNTMCIIFTLWSFLIILDDKSKEALLDSFSWLLNKKIYHKQHKQFVPDAFIEPLIIHQHKLEHFIFEQSFDMESLKMMRIPEDQIEDYKRRKFTSGMSKHFDDLLLQHPMLIEVNKPERPYYPQLEYWRFDFYINTDSFLLEKREYMKKYQR